MALFEKIASNSYSKVQFYVNEVSGSVDIANNTSRVEWSVWFTRINGWSWNADGGPLKISINGKTVYDKRTPFDLRNTTSQKLASGTETIKHDANGTKTIYCSTTFNTQVAEGTLTAGGNLKLTDILQKSEIGSVTGSTLGETCTVNISRKSSNFKHRCWYRLNGGSWVKTTDSAGTSFSFNLDYGFASGFGNSNSRTVDLSIETLNGSQSLGYTYKYGHTIYLPPASKITSVNATELGSNVTVNMSSNPCGYKHKIYYRFNSGSWHTLTEQTGGRYTFNLPLSHANDIPNSVNGLFDICVEDRNGTHLVGTNYFNGVNVKLPESVKPTLTSVRVWEQNKAITDVIGTENYYVQNLSDMRGEFNNAKGIYSSTITAYWAKIDGQSNTIYERGGHFGKMNFSGSKSIIFQVQDSRGRWSIPIKKTIQILPYQPPTIWYTAERSGSDNQTITVTRNISISPLTIGGKQKNVMKLKFQHKTSDSSTFIDNSGGGGRWAVTSQLLNSEANLSGTFSALKSYVIRGIVSDAFLESKTDVPVGVEKVLEYWSPLGTAFGKVWEKGILDVAGDMYVNGRNLLPTTDGGYSIAKGIADLDNLTKNEDMYIRSDSEHKPAEIGRLPMHLKYIGSNRDNGFQIGTCSNKLYPNLYFRMQDSKIWVDWQRLISEKELIATCNDMQRFPLTQLNGFAKRGENDCNKLVETGDYYLLGGQIKNGPPIRNIGSFIRVIAKDALNLTQFYCMNSRSSTYFGFRNQDGGIWTSWQQLATTSYTWQRPTLLNGWSNYGGDYQNFECTKDDTGSVSLRGNLKNSNSNFTGTIARLPSDIAPPRAMYFHVIHGNYETGAICIQGNGEITTRGSIKGSWLCLDGINYKI